MPSKTHEQLKIKALKWLNARVTGKGIRAASEVYIQEKYQADVVAICRLQGRFMDSLLPTFQEQKVISEPEPVNPLGPFSFVFECKQSMSDYLNTFDKPDNNLHMDARHQPVGNFHFIVVTKHLGDELSESSCPRGWGWLVEKGAGLSMEEKPSYAGHGYVDWPTMNKRVM